MSERYGTIGEMPEMVASLEEFLDEKVEEIRERFRSTGHDAEELRFDAGRKEAYEDVLDFIIANPGG